ncbi:hypothetical protein [Nonomuraea solani]|uniref:hypothetical protein n=1 Tax=Nonomuraea solani TaxID=1144553 RepID=UPI0013587098|nr:hypothetical protein [Nonomuraea solani]
MAVILAPPVLGLLTNLTGGFASDDGGRLRERRRRHVRRGQPPLPVPGVRARA